ncbi:MAG TPA: LOG family protein [Acidimicrobiales bacterium]|nr:LOG family protein [Acidimicrobiales bacterium]
MPAADPTPAAAGNPAPAVAGNPAPAPGGNPGSPPVANPMRPARRPRRGPTGRPEVDTLLEELLDTIGATHNRDQLLELLATVVEMGSAHFNRLDLKIASAALREMAEGFEVFSPYRHIRKVTMFGSARTASSDPLYAQARDLAALMADHGWSTVTGAGPGIMAAGLEGAGVDHAFGINIRLPFEQGANEFIASDPKLVSMKYFFTRKLLLIKESYGYAVLPGGFGTLDEAFELLTLLQTGKAEPAPVVLLDVPGGGYWSAWEDWVLHHVGSRRFINAEDQRLYRITDNVDDAAVELLDFYRNFHSLRWVGDTMVVRLQAAPGAPEVAGLAEEFSDVVDGVIQVSAGPVPGEGRQDSFPDLPRLAFRFRRVSYARLRQLIDAVNQLPSAPPGVVVR